VSKQNSFPAKLFLFGEYTALNGAASLAVPIGLYSGSWQEGLHQAYPFDLHAWYKYLLSDSLIRDHLDVERMLYDYRTGIRFVANIPIGGGLGSSGALTAAVYSKYCSTKLSLKEDLELIKRILSAMESFFHGESSGVDPLVSYARKAYYKDVSGECLLNDFEFPKEIKVSLIPTSTSRDTGAMVATYRNWLQDSNFKQGIKQNLIPLVSKCIDNFLKDEHSGFEDSIGGLSKYQWQHFPTMIIDEIKDLWQEGMDGSEFKLKLCGAGGGGFYLGFGNIPTEQEQLKLNW
jgi:mevalonate kinase